MKDPRDIVIGRNLQRLKKMARRTYPEIAVQIDRTTATVWGYAAGHRPMTARQLMRLAEYFGVEVKEFFVKKD
ncbi:MAG: helix-turn-helix transcriptional regulator [bacterium]|nr:helix-turn-helix transcriptional regulator [bacterium]